MDKYARLMQKLEIVNVELFKVCFHMQMCGYCSPTSYIASLSLNSFVYFTFRFCIVNYFRVFVNYLAPFSILFSSHLGSLEVRMLNPLLMLCPVSIVLLFSLMSFSPLKLLVGNWIFVTYFLYDRRITCMGLVQYCINSVNI